MLDGNLDGTFTDLDEYSDFENGPKYLDGNLDGTFTDLDEYRLLGNLPKSGRVTGTLGNTLPARLF